jgi:hypothetical protein
MPYSSARKVAVKSKNYAELYAALGFGEMHPNRPGVTILEAKLKPVDTNILSQGRPMPCSQAGSPEAYNLAEQFCQQLGSVLWPKDLEGGGLSWPQDKVKYIS